MQSVELEPEDGPRLELFSGPERPDRRRPPRAREQDIFHATYNSRQRTGSEGKRYQGRRAQALARAISEPPFAGYQKTVRDFLSREESEEQARREGRDLPVQAGDYVWIRGELRPETEPVHNHYAKILEVTDADIAAIESSKGAYVVRRDTESARG